MSHFDAAYSLARWLIKSPSDADDVVQEALLRAFMSFEDFRGTDGRAWLLSIVRNASYTWLRKNRSLETMTKFDEDLHGAAQATTNPELLHLRRLESEKLRECIEGLPLEFREVLVLYEIEGLSYRMIAEITGLPMGTVMSRLFRARHRVQECVSD